MNGTRILRYIGNRENPEPSLYSNAEILHDWPMMPAIGLAFMEEMALEVKGLSGIKPFPDYAFVTMPSPQNVVERKSRTKPEEKDFEVNLVEPLQGWKAWSFDGVHLISDFDDSRWEPLQPFAAQCGGGCKKIPAEHHTCGVYALSGDREVQEPTNGGNSVIGKVYGWGRYIRGTDGWRTEFAYPKCFYLANDQRELVDPLKKYQVPIFVFEPIQHYDPQDGGYENAHWENASDGNLGAGEESGSAEDDGEIPF